MNEVKICTKCGETKPCAEFSKNKGAKDGLKCQCKSCAKAYQLANKEALSIKAAEYYELNKEIMAVQRAEYREANKETMAIQKATYRQANKGAIAVKMAAYKKTPKGKLVDKNARHKRRALIKEGTVTTNELEQLTLTQDNCHYCNCDVTDGNSHLDHYIPLSKGGRHDLDNLVITCPTCNLKKGAKMPDVFIITLSVENQERLSHLH